MGVCIRVETPFVHTVRGGGDLVADVASQVVHDVCWSAMLHETCTSSDDPKSRSVGVHPFQRERYL